MCKTWKKCGEIFYLKTNPEGVSTSPSCALLTSLSNSWWIRSTKSRKRKTWKDRRRKRKKRTNVSEEEEVWTIKVSMTGIRLGKRELSGSVGNVKWKWMIRRGLLVTAAKSIFIITVYQKKKIMKRSNGGVKTVETRYKTREWPVRWERSWNWMTTISLDKYKI